MHDRDAPVAGGDADEREHRVAGSRRGQLAGGAGAHRALPRTSSARTQRTLVHVGDSSRSVGHRRRGSASSTNVQRGAKTQPPGALPGRRRAAGDADQRRGGRRGAGSPAISRRVYGCAAAAEELVGRPELDDPAGVHHGDAVRERADDGEVVADVERRDAVGGGQLAHGVEHVRLRRHVEAGRRLVEHDHARPAGEGHREADALLLAARELVRVAAQVRRRRRAARTSRIISATRSRSLAAARAEAVHLERLAQLRADPQRRVERGGRILRHVRDDPAAQRAPLRAG